MDLTTATRVKRRLGITDDDATNDEVIGSLIARVSDECEDLMNRDVESTLRTVQRDSWYGMRSLSLRGYPVTSVTSMHNDIDRLFGSETLIDAADYYVELESGLIHFEFNPFPAKGGLQIVYTGGMATSTANFIAAYPGIADAVDQRVCQLWQRRNEIGVASLGSGQGNLSNQTIDWAPDSLAAVMRHRRMGRA